MMDWTVQQLGSGWIVAAWVGECWSGVTINGNLCRSSSLRGLSEMSVRVYRDRAEATAEMVRRNSALVAPTCRRTSNP